MLIIVGSVDYRSEVSQVMALRGACANRQVCRPEDKVSNGCCRK